MVSISIPKIVILPRCGRDLLFASSLALAFNQSRMRPAKAAGTLG
jgi:hypothetical protein